MPCGLVVIGCSWGGVRALIRLLEHLPAGFSAPIAVAQHRGADSSDTALHSTLSPHTSLQVRGVEDKDAIEEHCLHLAPPDYHLLVEPGRFALSLEGPVHFARPSIDVLFDSAAEAYGDELVGVVLTGANADGAAGLRRIKARGGHALVQNPDTAERPEMPAAAIAVARPDRVCSIEKIAAALGERCEATVNQGARL